MSRRQKQPHTTNSAGSSPIAGKPKKPALLHSALNLFSEGIMITRGRDWLTSKILFANGACSRITGYSLHKMSRKAKDILLGSDMSPEIMDQICADLGAGLSTRAQIVQHRKDGTPYDAEVSVTPIRRHRGGLVTFVAIHRDMTARKQLHKYQKDLRSMALELAFAEEQERQRLAENLHDELGPLLFQARLKLELFSRQSPDDTHELADILERMGRIVSRMQFELSPLLLNRLGLRRAIRALAAEMKQKYGLSVEIVEDGEEISVDQRMASVLFRSLRELLINVAKHAETDKARLTVRRLDHIIQIEVEDDGAGFDPRSQSKHVDFGHFGLFSIRERLTYLGGSFDVRSAPGAGATMTLTARV